ncbi:MAG: amidohydrolase family protein [Spirochaetota bacterium]
MTDAHTHIFFPEAIANRESYFHDHAFSLLYNSPRSIIADAQTLYEYMDRSQITTAFVFGFCWKDIESCVKHNDYLINTSTASTRPFATLPPKPGTGTDRLFKQIAGLPFTGIGEITFYTEIMSDNTFSYLRDIFTFAHEQQLILSLHINEPVGHEYPGKYHTPFDLLYSLITEFPDVDIILSHWGGGLFVYELMPEVRSVFKRVYYDTAASPFLYEPSVYHHAMSIAGEEKVLFGTDFPLLRPDRYLRDIGASGLSDSRREKLLSLNAQNLLERHRQGNRQHRRNDQNTEQGRDN